MTKKSQTIIQGFEPNKNGEEIHQDEAGIKKKNGLMTCIGKSALLVFLIVKMNSTEEKILKIGNKDKYI